MQYLRFLEISNFVVQNVQPIFFKSRNITYILSKRNGTEFLSLVNYKSNKLNFVNGWVNCPNCTSLPRKLFSYPCPPHPDVILSVENYTKNFIRLFILFIINFTSNNFLQVLSRGPRLDSGTSMSSVCSHLHKQHKLHSSINLFIHYMKIVNGL